MISNQSPMLVKPVDAKPKYRHIDYISLLKAVGYPNDIKGICRGLASTAADYALSGKFTAFISTLKQLGTEDQQSIVQKFNQVKGYHATKKLNHLIHIEQSSESLQHHRETQDKVQFLDTVFRHQSPFEHANLRSSPLLQLQESKNNAPPPLSNTTTEIYFHTSLLTVTEFDLFLSTVERITHDTPPATDFFISIASDLQTGRHAVGIYFEKEKSLWHIVDANKIELLINGEFSISQDIAFQVNTTFNDPEINYLYQMGNSLHGYFDVLHILSSSEPEAKQLIDEMKNFADNIKIVDRKTITSSATILKKIKEYLKKIRAIKDETPEKTQLTYQDYTIRIYAKTNTVNELKPFIESIIKNHEITVIQQLTAEKLQRKTNNGFSLAHIYALNNRHQELKKLIEADIKNLTIRSNKGHQPLFYASFNGNNQTLCTLLECKETDLQQEDSEGLTPVLSAISLNHVDALSTMIHSTKCDINYESKNEDISFTPALLAISSENNDLLQLIIDHKEVNLNQANRSGVTPLIASVYVRNITALVTLLESKKADSYFESKNENLTVAHASIIFPEGLNMLAAYGIDLDRTNSAGQTPLDLAITSNKKENDEEIKSSIALLKDYKQYKSLIEKLKTKKIDLNDPTDRRLSEYLDKHIQELHTNKKITITERLNHAKAAINTYEKIYKIMHSYSASASYRNQALDAIKNYLIAEINNPKHKQIILDFIEFDNYCKRVITVRINYTNPSNHDLKAITQIENQVNLYYEVFTKNINNHDLKPIEYQKELARKVYKIKSDTLTNYKANGSLHFLGSLQPRNKLVALLDSIMAENTKFKPT